jgi:hypothetical protein
MPVAPVAPVDPAALRAAYEHQLALLIPVVDELEREAVAPSPLVADGWRGPAAEAAEDLLHDLRRALHEAAGAVDDEVKRVRHRLAELL